MVSAKFRILILKHSTELIVIISNNKLLFLKMAQLFRRTKTETHRTEVKMRRDSITTLEDCLSLIS